MYSTYALVVLGPAGPCSGRFYFVMKFSGRKYLKVFNDLFAFLSSIRGCPDVRKGWKIKLTRT